MSSHSGQYRALAQAAAKEAEAAQLENVRERCMRSAMAWTHMAERAERHEESRLKAEAQKLEAASHQAMARLD